MPDTQAEGGENPANPTAIRVFSTGKSLKIKPFKIPENPLEIGRAWEEWIEDFEEETSYFEITKVRDQVSALKIYGGQEIKKLAHNLPDTAPVEGDDDYKKLKRKLKRTSIMQGTHLASKGQAKERALLPTRRDCERSQRTVNSASKLTIEYWNI